MEKEVYFQICYMQINDDLQLFKWRDFYDHYKTLLLLIIYYQIKEKRKLSYCKTKNRFIKMLLKLSNYNLRIGLLNCDLLNVTDNILSRKRSRFKK